MIPRVTIKWHSATIPKSRSLIEENEDAFAPNLGNGEIHDCEFFQCALSDGATRSSFAGEFARIIVEQCALSQKNAGIYSVISQTRSIWSQRIKSLDLPWHAQEKVKEGAYATLLWLQFFPKGTNHILWDNHWRSTAVGDTCLFQFRKDQPLKHLPIKNSMEFNNHPPLISSHNRNSHPIEEWENSGSWESGDDFFLASDAMAKWILHSMEQKKNPATILKDRLTRKAKEGHFQEWIVQMRSRREIKDDDTTLIWIKVI